LRGPSRGLCLYPDPREQIQPVALLGDDRRIDDLRDGARGFRRPVTRHWLSWRLAAARSVRACVSANVAANAWHNRREECRQRQGGGILLADNHFFPNARHSSW